MQFTQQGIKIMVSKVFNKIRRAMQEETENFTKKDSIKIVQREITELKNIITKLKNLIDMFYSRLIQRG